MSDPFSKISWMLESARDLTIEAAMSASSRLSETPTAKRPQEIVKLLNSRTDRDVLNGMKCVMALVGRGEDGQPFFADVVKNVTSPSARVRALVLIYLSKYGESEPDTALLSINSIQKSLSDKSAVARAASIRALAGIRISEIGSLILLCIKRTVSDQSPHVRAASALAIGRAFHIDGINRSQLASFLAGLVGDSSVAVVCSALKVHVKLLPSLSATSPKKAWAPIHANFRRICRLLPQMDEWAQISAIDLFTEYARKFLPRPELTFEDGSTMPLPEFADFASLPSYTVSLDSDLQLFVDSLRKLVYSYSEAVILSVARALILIATPEHLVEFDLPRILTKLATTPVSGSSARSYALHVVAHIAQTAPAVFEKYYRKFYVFPTDDNTVASLKLHALPLLATQTTAKEIIKELQYSALNSAFRPHVAHEAVRALGRCSRASKEWTNHILRWCSLQISNVGATPIVSDLLTVIRHLLQLKQSQAGSDRSEIESVVRTIYKLGKLLNDNTVSFDPDAKATIIWLVGEFTEAADNLIGPDLLRRALKTFSNEPENVRYQLLILAAKSYSYEIQKNDSETLADTPIGKMYAHVSQLAHYDASFDTRDRVRMLDQLLFKPKNSKLATLLLQVPKPAPLVAVSFDEDTPAILRDYLSVEGWADPETLPPKSIRKETAVEVVPTSFENGAFQEKKNVPTSSSHQISSASIKNLAPVQAKPYKLQSLDEFFGNEETESESEEESEEEEESDEQSVSESGLDSDSDENEEDDDGEESDDSAKSDDKFLN
ncbi:uncharacterized protein CXQ87_001375 [Candidozyma duobushaemuli]|uniref:Clathrin/coatomer adaptor adaptin-like N-terminal domain-containing protein n=2 Tax=Candidozyma TaxID=3303203 RepID=A0ABX8I1A3_9ASCO|nr:uncharacterized protein CXQ87_001375 [[Candida] duobushaemulonis]PVH18448.1 hypothetical protein CXQ87_001375 [[Candida] duobushaemulonis]QWU86985.1 hypothetical protein CA3LBN_001203 [[Candida] haemuloni]